MNVFQISTYVFFTVILIVNIIHRQKYIKIEDDIHDDIFLFWLGVIICMSIGILLFKNKKESPNLRSALSQAWMAFIIAYFAHLEMVFAAFFFIFILSYSKHMK